MGGGSGEIIPEAERIKQVKRMQSTVLTTDKAGQIRAQKGPLGLASRRSLETWRGAVSVRLKYKNLMMVVSRMSGMREIWRQQAWASL